MATITEKNLAVSPPSNSSMEKVADSSSSQLEVAKAENGVDVVVGLVAYHDQDAEIDPAESKKLLNRLDWHILPLLCGLYTCEHIPSVNIDI
jgi:hypothetical protein